MHSTVEHSNLPLTSSYGNPAWVPAAEHPQSSVQAGSHSPQWQHQPTQEAFFFTEEEGVVTVTIGAAQTQRQRLNLGLVAYLLAHATNDGDRQKSIPSYPRLHEITS